MKKRLALIAVILAGLLFPLFIFPPTPAKAQSGVLCQNWDFSASDQGFTDYEAGFGHYTGSSWLASNVGQYALDIISPTVSIASVIQVQVDATFVDLDTTTPGPIVLFGDPGVLDNYAGFNNSVGSHTYTTTISATTITFIRFYYQSNSTNAPIAINAIRLYCTAPTATPTLTPTSTFTPTALGTLPVYCSTPIATNSTPVATNTPGPTSTGTPYTATPTYTPTPTITNVPFSSPTVTNTPSGPTNTPTSGPSPTATPVSPTPPCIPPPPPSTNPNTCTFLGDDIATFANLPGQWKLTPPDTGPSNPPNATLGLYILAGSATLSLQLNPSHSYSILAKYRVAPNQTGVLTGFTIQMGATTAKAINVASGGQEQVYNSDPQTYTPTTVSAGVNIYNLIVARDASDNAARLIVDSLCITDNTPTPQQIINTQLCVECVYHPQGGLDHLWDDIVAIVRWLGCQLTNLWLCVFQPIFLGLWRGILAIGHFFVLVGSWFALAIGNGVSWALSNLGVILRWLGGGIRNLLSGVANAIINGLVSLGIFGFLSQVISLIGGIASGFIALVTTAIDWIGAVIQLVIAVLLLIPEVIIGIITGFNNSSSLPIYAITCSDPSSLLYFPCIGLYVADNTIWDGPAFYLVYIIMGFISLRILIWTIEYIRASLTDGEA